MYDPRVIVLAVVCLFVFFWFIYKFITLTDPELYIKRGGKPTPLQEWFTL